MGKKEKFIRKLLTGRSDSNIPFSELITLLESLGFDHRQKGSHHILTKSGITERINLQDGGGNAKSYQVRQVRKVLIENRLIEDE
jgi:predicted RNA binding protein YcfA (HicA-like mRNA interferase family)